MNIYQNILVAKQQKRKLLAVLIDPEKVDLKNLSSFFEKIHQSIATHIFVGGSTDKKLIYLEAGSGATVPVDANIIKEVNNQLRIPLIVGGGIKTKQQLDTAFTNGADLVVIGTAFENDVSFFNDLKKQ